MSFKDQMNALLTAPAAAPNAAAASSDPEDDTDLDMEALRATIRNNHARVTDLFKSWDEDGNGKVSKTEFRRAILALGFTATKDHIDLLFDQMDKDAAATSGQRVARGD